MDNLGFQFEMSPVVLDQQQHSQANLPVNEIIEENVAGSYVNIRRPILNQVLFYQNDFLESGSFFILRRQKFHTNYQKFSIEDFSASSSTSNLTKWT